MDRAEIDEEIVMTTDVDKISIEGNVSQPVETMVANDRIPRRHDSHLIIVVDSNILIQNYGFNSHNMRNLLEFAERTNAYIYLHKIVMEEVCEKIAYKCNESIEQIEKKIKRVRKLGS
jgi:hypothetical protein